MSDEAPGQHSAIRTGREIALFVVGYAAALLYARSLIFGEGILPAFWAPDAVLLCALLLSARRRWWVYLLLAFSIRLGLGAAWPSPLDRQLWTFLNDALKALLAASCLRYLKPKGSWLSSAADFAVFIFFAVFTVPAMSALGGVAIRHDWGARFWPTWTGWFLGDALANLLLTPLILSLAAWPSLAAGAPASRGSWRRSLEAGVLLVGLVVSGAWAFGERASGPALTLLMCLPFPFLLWAATRFGVRGTSGALSLFAFSSVWVVAHSPAPAGLRAELLSLQLFLSIVGSSLLFVAVVLDERREVQETLRATQGRLVQAEAMSLLMSAHVGLDGRWLQVPRRLADLLGYKRRELLASRSHDLTHPEDLARELRELDRLVRGEIPSYQVEKRFLKADGTPVWVYLTRTLVRDEEGRPTQFLDHVADINERKLSEAALRSSEAQLRLFAEHSPAAVALLDSELRFVVASRRFRTNFLDESSSPVGRRYDEALVDFPRAWPHALRGALEGDVEFREEDSFTRADGTVEFLRWEIRPAEPSAIRGFGALLFAEMTTDRHRAERALDDLRHQLTHLTRVTTLGELSGAIAHELNQPLAAILANAQAAQRFLALGRDGVTEVAAILEDIVTDDLRASEVIRKLRNLLRKGESDFQSLDLNDVVREVLELARGDLVTRNVVVVRELAQDLPHVRGDRVQLQQVLLNLVLNACEAMGAQERGERKLRIATHGEPYGNVVAAVQDSGPGVPFDMRDRVFEPFQTSKSSGLGLGLAICRTLVMSHGGRVWVGEGESGGALFQISLPSGDGRSAPPSE